MKIFAPGNPFLKSVAARITATGGPDYFVVRKDGREVLSASWFPELRHGVLYYYLNGGDWAQDEPEEEASACDEILMLDISSDGLFQVRSGEGDAWGVFFKTHLKSGDEVDELLEFYSSARATDIGSTKSKPKPLSALIDGVFLLIPADPVPQLLPLRGQKLSTDLPDIANMVDCWLRNDAEAISSMGYWDFGAWLDDNNFRQALGPQQKLESGDLIFTGHGSVQYAGLLLAGADSDLGYAPAVVLRPKAEVSHMWLFDYLEHASEAEGLTEKICKGWKHLPKGLARLEVTIPRCKRDQVADVIQRRNARFQYLHLLTSAMRVREPFELIADIYQKRTRAAQGLNTELLDDLVAVQYPLPFFLEYPYRLYRREGDHVRRVRAGQRLLGILAKVPLFLVVEELLAGDHSLGTELLAKLEERPLSDGAFVDLQRFAGGKIAKFEQSPLSLFAGLVEVLNSPERLQAMVTARNRMHHEPYDEQGFLKAVDDIAPLVIDSLRAALSGCRFFVPLHAKIASGVKVVTAEDACSVDAHFRTIDLRVSLPLEQFPSDELMVWKAEPEFSLILGKLLKAKVITQQSRDFGIFDRMQNEEPHFTFLRSD